MRIRSMIALALLGALAVVAFAIPAMAHDNDDHGQRGGNTDHHSGGGLDRLSLGSGGKLTLKLLERGEAQSLAEVYASEETGGKVERDMRRGLIVFCHPGGYDTLSFTCGADTTTALRTVPAATVPQTTVPQTTVPQITTPQTTTPPATASASATASAPATTP